MFLRRCRLARPSMPGITFPAALGNNISHDHSPLRMLSELAVATTRLRICLIMRCMRMPAEPCDRAPHSHERRHSPPLSI